MIAPITLSVPRPGVMADCRFVRIVHEVVFRADQMRPVARQIAQDGMNFLTGGGREADDRQERKLTFTS
jgi:hypothetical protein